MATSGWSGPPPSLFELRRTRRSLGEGGRRQWKVDSVMDYIWLIPVLPGLGAAINGLVGIRSFSKKTAGGLAVLTMTGALGLSLIAFAQLLGLPAESRAHDVVIADWIPPMLLGTSQGIGRLEIPWGFRLDPLSAMMALVVTGIGTLIHIY